MQKYIITSPVGNIAVHFAQQQLAGLEYVTDDEAISNNIPFEYKKVIDELMAYFKNPNHQFSINHTRQGSAHQQKVWKALTKIPRGKVKTYGELAKELSSSPRAIGQACRSNPIPIIIPCHRVVGAKNIGGYAGDSEGRLAKIKEWLLQHELSLQNDSCGLLN